MKKLKLLAAPALFALVLCMAGTSFAQAPQIMAVGSSGAFTSAVAAMVTPDPTIGDTTAVCGTNVWTQGNSSAVPITATDPRSGTIPLEPGTVAVVWDNSTSPTKVCVYLSIDSIVGLRLFLAQSGAGGVAGNGFLNISSTVVGSSTVAGVAGQNKVGFIVDTVNNTCGPTGTSPCGLPQAVYNLVNGAHFNVAFSDIRPDDGQYAYGRAACTPADEISCLGYGPLNGVGTAILSSFNSANVANVIAFNISGGADQFTGLTVPATKVFNIGAYPIMFFYNATDTSTGGLGALLPKNILSHTLTGFLSGQLGLNQDLVGASQGANAKPVDVVVREPVSGTYNTTEFQIVHDRDGNSGMSQETGFTPTSLGTNCYTIPNGAPTYQDPDPAFGSAATCSNPMRVPGLDNHRFRAIGTGELVAAVNSTNGANRLGYGFFSMGTFASSKAGNTRYLALDGVDPIYPSYSTNNGVFPTCTGNFNTGGVTCSGTSPAITPTFDGVKAGNYRVWNIIRALRYTSYTAPSVGPSVDDLIAAAQDQAFASTAPDFVPVQHCTAGGSGACTAFTPVLTVFRSHYALPATSGLASNGNPGQSAENGGDMAGAIFNIQSDVDAFNISGVNFITWIQ